MNSVIKNFKKDSRPLFRGSVLTNRSLKASAVDTVSASEQLAEALTRKVGGEEALAIRDRLISQSRAQLRVGLNAK